MVEQAVNGDMFKNLISYNKKSPLTIYNKYHTIKYGRKMAYNSKNLVNMFNSLSRAARNHSFREFEFNQHGYCVYNPQQFHRFTFSKLKLEHIEIVCLRGILDHQVVNDLTDPKIIPAFVVRSYCYLSGDFLCDGKQWWPIIGTNKNDLKWATTKLSSRDLTAINKVINDWPNQQDLI